MSTYNDDDLETAVDNYVNGWDMDTLIEYASDRLYDYFKKVADTVEIQDFIDEYGPGD